jgi:hypothetical protein
MWELIQKRKTGNPANKIISIAKGKQELLIEGTKRTHSPQKPSPGNL